MCIAIVEVKYKIASTPSETIKFDDEAKLESRLVTLKENEQVARIIVFRPAATHTLQTQWVIT